MSYISETAANCAGILERGARRMAEAAKREAILKAEMRAAIAASKPVVIPQQQQHPKYRFWAAEEQSRFIALRKEGKTMREIAHELGRNYYSVVHFGVKLKAWGKALDRKAAKLGELADPAPQPGSAQ